MIATIHRRAHFNAAHRLYRPEWSDEKNRTVFGLCSNPEGHGHNYELIISLTGEINPETGFVYDLARLKHLIEQHVTSVYDHKNLNTQVKPFDTTNPTTENIAVDIYRRLRPHIESNLDIQVRLYETPRNFVDYSGG